MDSRNIIQEKAFNFAVKSVHLYKAMVENKEYVFSRQLLKSSTSIGANIEEAIAGISKKTLMQKWRLLLKKQGKHCIG